MTDPKNNELLPCPLCKGSNVESYRKNKKNDMGRINIAIVKCLDCRCKAPYKKWQERVNAVQPINAPKYKWNGNGYDFENIKDMPLIGDPIDVRELVESLQQILHHQVHGTPKPRELCKKFAYITVVKSDEGKFGLTYSGMLNGNDVINCLQQHGYKATQNHKPSVQNAPQSEHSSKACSDGEQVERVARAIWKARQKFNEADYPLEDYDERFGGDIPIAEANGILLEAKAAILSLSHNPVNDAWQDIATISHGMGKAVEVYCPERRNIYLVYKGPTDAKDEWHFFGGSGKLQEKPSHWKETSKPPLPTSEGE